MEREEFDVDKSGPEFRADGLGVPAHFLEVETLKFTALHLEQPVTAAYAVVTFQSLVYLFSE